MNGGEVPLTRLSMNTVGAGGADRMLITRWLLRQSTLLVPEFDPTRVAKKIGKSPVSEVIVLSQVNRTAVPAVIAPAPVDSVWASHPIRIDTSTSKVAFPELRTSTGIGTTDEAQASFTKTENDRLSQTDAAVTGAA
jgi:hypothetical protein